MYGWGDLKFGHLTFIVLTGILVRDLFPDPDIVCQFLNGNQWHVITWFYEWILKSVEGVEVQEQDARSVLTRSQMICALRYRDERSKLSKIPPPWIVLWSRMVGSWPSLTFGGCRNLHFWCNSCSHQRIFPQPEGSSCFRDCSNVGGSTRYMYIWRS